MLFLRMFLLGGRAVEWNRKVKLVYEAHCLHEVGNVFSQEQQSISAKKSNLGSGHWQGMR